MKENINKNEDRKTQRDNEMQVDLQPATSKRKNKRNQATGGSESDNH